MGKGVPSKRTFWLVYAAVPRSWGLYYSHIAEVVEIVLPSHRSEPSIEEAAKALSKRAGEIIAKKWIKAISPVYVPSVPHEQPTVDPQIKE